MPHCFHVYMFTNYEKQRNKIVAQWCGGVMLWETWLQQELLLNIAHTS